MIVLTEKIYFFESGRRDLYVKYVSVKGLFHTAVRDCLGTVRMSLGCYACSASSSDALWRGLWLSYIPPKC